VKFPVHKSFRFTKLANTLDIAYKLHFKFLPYLKENAEENIEPITQTTKMADYRIIAFAIVVTGPENTPLDQSFYMGRDATSVFIEELLRLTAICNDKVKNDPIPLNPSEEDKERFSKEIFCHYCQKEFTTKNYKVYHHRHVNSVMYGEELTPRIEIICNKCNLALKQKAVVALGHELAQLEYHFILNALDAKAIQSAKVLCRDTENIIAIEINGLRIVDTSNFFCNVPLDSLITRQKGRSSHDDMKDKFPNL
jgi:hypothetical protein